MSPLRGPVVVTGTDTGVGKTVVTAAIAASAAAAGLRVAVVKLAQTGVATGDEFDAATIARLADPATVRTLAAFPAPLAPLAAARISGTPPLAAMAAHLRVREAGRNVDLVLIEGAGGLLVPIGEGRWTIAELAVSLGAAAVVVVRAGLGTLNHTALTLEALARRKVAALVVVGAWPAQPELVHRANARDLAGELAGVLPERAGELAPLDFRRRAASWLSRALYGHFDATAFRRQGR